MFEIKFADIGEGLTEGIVQEVYVKIGAIVKAGDVLFNVETDKITSDISTPIDGKISKILISQGQEIKVGQVVIEIDFEKNITEVENINNIKNSKSAFEDVEQKSIIKATPLARKMATSLKVDLNQIIPSGPNNRILAKDIKSFCQTQQKADKNFDKLTELPKLSSFHVEKNTQSLSFEEKRMNAIRKATIKAMEKSHKEIAAFTGFKNADISELVELRKQLKESTENENIKLSYLSFIIKATTLVLKNMPNINVRINKENNSIFYMQQINIGVACDTPEGLMVPVIKNADKLSVVQIANKIDELVLKAKTKKLEQSEITGATFTISNFGTVGLDYATPIINFPEAAILGLGTITTQPVYINNQIIPRNFMPFSLSADHRIIDGADAGRFIQKLTHYLKNPITLLL